MFQREGDFNEEIYTSFYGPKTGADGVWELPLVLETVSEASGSTIPLPLPYRRLNAEVLEYLEDVAQLVPKDEEARGSSCICRWSKFSRGSSKNSTRC